MAARSAHVHQTPGRPPGWHHHGEHQTAAYVLCGALRVEFGPGGKAAIDAGPGEFVHIPRQVVHRKGDPSDEPGSIVVTRAGTGQVVFNVDGPEPAG